MKIKRYFTHPFKLAIDLATCLILGITAASLLLSGAVVPAVFFFIFAAIFAYSSALCGSVISIEPDGFRRSLFAKTLKFFRLDEIAEVGVIGSGLFHRAGKESRGTVYIYFSKTEMTAEERYDMILKWPPKDKLYMRFTADRLNAVESVWKGDIHSYNTNVMGR